MYMRTEILGSREFKRLHPMAGEGSNWTAARKGRVTVVIADSGASAEVLVFAPGETVKRGVEFSHRGTMWVVTSARRDSGILVAEPAAH